MARRSSKRSRSSSGRAGFGRALSLLAFLPIASRVPMYTRLITSLVMDDRMPASRKAMLAGAAGYLVLGRDLIPDDIPIIGGLDDLVVVVLAADSSSMACRTTCSTRSSPSSASSVPNSIAMSPRCDA